VGQHLYHLKAKMFSVLPVLQGINTGKLIQNQSDGIGRKRTADDKAQHYLFRNYQRK
jgi:hypothetical protein